MTHSIYCIFTTTANIVILTTLLVIVMFCKLREPIVTLLFSVIASDVILVMELLLMFCRALDNEEHTHFP